MDTFDKVSLFLVIVVGMIILIRRQWLKKQQSNKRKVLRQKLQDMLTREDELLEERIACDDGERKIQIEAELKQIDHDWDLTMVELNGC